MVPFWNRYIFVVDRPSYIKGFSLSKPGCEGTKGLRRKAWTQTKILSPNIRYFVIVVLRCVAICAIFGRLWAKKVLFYIYF